MIGLINKIKKIMIQVSSYPKRLWYKNISLLSIVSNSKVSRKAKLSPYTKFYSSEIGDYSYIGWKTVVTDAKIGNFCSIAGDCVIGGASHPINWVSTSPIFYSGKNIFGRNFSDNNYDDVELTIIKNDVWVAANVLIRQGVVIGNGAVIGMGSVVTKNIGAYEIWAGNPAKKIGDRFESNVSEVLDKSHWWNFSEDELKKYSKNFNNISRTVEKFEESNK